MKSKLLILILVICTKNVNTCTNWVKMVGGKYYCSDDITPNGLTPDGKIPELAKGWMAV